MSKTMSTIRALLLSAMLLAIAAAPATVARTGPPLDGGWRRLKDVSNPHIQELGRWAVAEQARRANDRLRFDRVTRGEMQIVAGVNYNLVLDAADADGATTAYRAFVNEGLTDTRTLMSFSALN